ncbi:MAG: signal peptidase I [Lachnospiraceae bacterium]|nr:signal peptidase I [Lachnospiraceae bacterium]
MSERFEDDDIEFIYWGDGNKPPVKYVEEEVKNERHYRKVYKQSKRNVRKKYVILKREVFNWVKLIACAIFLAFIISNFIIINALVPSSSMEPTIMEGDRMIGFRLAYIFDEVERGDIIIFKYPDDHSQKFVKRVVGMPGEYIEIINGMVYISNSEDEEYKTQLPEDYLTVMPEGNMDKIRIPEGSYFVMGDNRNDSEDSRYWNDQFVSEDEILGEAIFVYWPLWPQVID